MGGIALCVFFFSFCLLIEPHHPTHDTTAKYWLEIMAETSGAPDFNRNVTTCMARIGLQQSLNCLLNQGCLVKSNAMVCRDSYSRGFIVFLI